MIEGWTVTLLGFGYVGTLFALAWAGDRFVRVRKDGGGRPLIYALSLAVYCSSWTFFGSVGLSAATGYDFIPVYLGPVLMFALGWPLLQRIVRIAKSQNITSVADFLAARYGKSPAVAAIVAAIAVAGTLPYMALQLKAVAVSIETLLGPRPLGGITSFTHVPIDTALVVAMALAIFAVLFGTRHIDATEHQDGLMLAVATESVVKLAAFLAIGAFVLFTMLGGPVSLLGRIRESRELTALFSQGLNGGMWMTVTLLSLVCIILLPRQFHVTVVESNSESEIKRAAWLFPLYLVLINLFVVPIAAAGKIYLLPGGSVTPDMFVLSLPLAVSADWLAILAFIGGLSAATAMVIVDGVALAIMICNGCVVPWLLSRQLVGDKTSNDEAVAGLLLPIRRVVILAVLFLAYVVHHALGQVHGLAQIGLISFAVIAQLAPAFFGGLVWRRATARGAIAGILAGFTLWAYTLLLPWIARAGFMPLSVVNDGPFGIGLLKPEALLYLNFDPLPHGVLLSLMFNVATFVFVSLLRPPVPIERLQSQIFVLDDLPRPVATPVFRLWRTTLTMGDLKQTVGRYLGDERAERSFREHVASRAMTWQPHAEADVATIRFTEHLLSSAIGAASARLVLSLLLKRGNVSSQSALRLLDDASEAIQYNRDLLQSALDQVRHGLSVFDRDMQLICWNRQFRELLGFPAQLGRVGVPLQQILRAVAENDDVGSGSADAFVTEAYVKLAVDHRTFQLRMRSRNRILEIRTVPLPQGGIVTTYSDITDRVAAADALERANETLERRVRERTTELLNVNAALAVAKTKADEANLDKTRFLAAASHDILQPLNAARLYASSLLEQTKDAPEERLARNIDASLDAVEEILGALLDISRLDAGHTAPEWQAVSLADIFERLRLEFEPMARAKGLELRFVETKSWVRSDRKLLQRVLQNLVGNAVKYTRRGGVVVGCRRRGDDVVIQVSDTGPGIPSAKQDLIFKEFRRLEETAATVRGLGLGLSIVERIGKVLGTQVGVVSTPGQGSTFSVRQPRASAGLPEVRKSPATGVGVDISGCLALCIDNEADVLDAMQALLSGWGCRTILAVSGEAARSRLSGDPVRPDIVFLDYHLDEGSGLEALQLLRPMLGPDVPAVIITADYSAEVQREVRQAGCGLLRKPLKAAALRATISQMALKRAAAAE